MFPTWCYVIPIVLLVLFAIAVGIGIDEIWHWVIRLWTRH